MPNTILRNSASTRRTETKKSGRKLYVLIRPSSRALVSKGKTDGKTSLLIRISNSSTGMLPRAWIIAAELLKSQRKSQKILMPRELLHSWLADMISSQWDARYIAMVNMSGSGTIRKANSILTC